MMQVSFSPEKRIFSLPPRHRDRIRAIFQRYTGFDAIHRSAEVDAWIARTEEAALRALSAEAVCRLEPLSEVTPEGILTCSGIRFSSPRMGEVLRSACGMAAMAVRLRGWEALQGRGAAAAAERDRLAEEYRAHYSPKDDIVDDPNQTRLF